MKTKKVYAIRRDKNYDSMWFDCNGILTSDKNKAKLLDGLKEAKQIKNFCEQFYYDGKFIGGTRENNVKVVIEEYKQVIELIKEI